MNQNDLERVLSQPSPKEAGSSLRSLPVDLAAAREEISRMGSGRARRGLLATGTALAAVAAVSAGLAVGLSRPAAPPTGGVGSDATPSATPQAIEPCQIAALEATAEPWGAAAGSRGTRVTVQNAGSVSCTLPSQPGAAIYAGGEDLVHMIPDGRSLNPPSKLELAPGDAAVTSVIWSNWCDERSVIPDGLALLLEGRGLSVTPDPNQPEILVPPCMGSDPTSLSTIEFEPR